MNIQLKWDKELIINFFKNPHYKMSTTTYVFKENNKITWEQFHELKRVPIQNNLGHQKSDIYGFVARYLPGLYKMIENKEIEDSIDIVLYLKSSNIDVIDTVSKDTLNYKRECGQHSINKIERRLLSINNTRSNIYQDSLRSAWHICKQRK